MVKDAEANAAADKERDLVEAKNQADSLDLHLRRPLRTTATRSTMPRRTVDGREGAIADLKTALGPDDDDPDHPAKTEAWPRP